jgi:hypothetical protein
MRDIKKLSWNDFIKQYDASVVDAIGNNRKKQGVNGIATLQCEVFDSSRFGQITALIYGNDCTFKSIEDMRKTTCGIYVTGLPSSAAFPINYTEDMPV